MVIVHIANIDPAVIGGVQIAVPKMVKAQSKYARVGLLNTHGEEIDGVEAVRFQGEPNMAALAEPFGQPDILVFHEVYRFEYVRLYRQCLKLRIPYVIVPHGCLSKKAQQRKWIKKTAANVLFFNRFIKHARRVQYLSDNEKNMSVFPDVPRSVWGNGVSLPAEKAQPLPQNGIRFVYIGRLEIRIKGLDLLLSAVKKCEAALRARSAVVDLYGPDYGGAHETLSRMIRNLGISDIVRLGKEKMGEEKKEILLAATCFIQTSRTEGLPLGPLEALSYGLPCIVTRGVGLGGRIEDYGAGYQCPNSPEGIAEAMERFLENLDDVERMSRSAVRLIEEHYDMDAVARRTVDGYQQTIDELKG